MAEDKKIAFSVEIDGVERSVNSIKDLKQALKDAKDEQLRMANSFGEGSKEFKKATQNISNLKDKVEDLADSTKSLKGSGIERASEGFSQLGEGLRNLDFDKVKVGLVAMKSALAAVGIGLIVQAVVYLVENFESLSKGSDVLAKALRFVGDIITSITDAAYALTDALGLTNHALDVQGETIVKNAEKTKEALGEQTSEYDRLIAVAKANGESTVELELAKQKAIQATNAEILKQMLAYVQAGGVLDEEQNKLLKATLANVKDTHTAIQVIEATDKKDQIEKSKKHSEDLLKIKEDQYKRELELKALRDGQLKGDEEFATLLANIEREKLAKQTAYDEEQNSLTQSNIYYDSLRKQNQEASDEASRIKEKEENEQAQQDKANATLAIVATSLESTRQLTDLYFAFKSKTLEKGSAEELKAAKKQFQINKSLAIASATISGIQGVVNALSAQSVIPEPFGTILKVASAVGVGIAAAVNIAKISSSKFDAGGGGSIGSASAGSAPSVPIPSPPTINTPSANTNQSTTFDKDGKNLNAQQPTIKVNATIGVDEINKTQNRVSVLEKQSTF